MHLKRRKQFITGTGGMNKVAILGIIERKGKVRAIVVPSTRRHTLTDHIRQNVEKGATLYTDALPSYVGLDRDYVHHVINHAVEYVNGHVHTNSIEGFWSVFERTIKGTYVAPRPWQLQRYVEEQVFRFNAREESDGPRFVEAAKVLRGSV